MEKKYYKFVGLDSLLDPKDYDGVFNCDGDSCCHCGSDWGVCDECIIDATEEMILASSKSYKYHFNPGKGF